MSDWVDVALVESWEKQAIRLIDLDDTMVAIFYFQDKFYAIENVCTHDYCPLIDENEPSTANWQQHRIICPRHGAEFDVTNGKVLAPPAYEDLTVFPTRIEEGMVQVRDPRWD